MQISAKIRQVQGSGASRRLRRAGTVPGVLYGANQPATNLEFNHNELFHSLRKPAFHSSILTLVIDGKEEKALLRDFQAHPYKQLVLHIDLQRVDANTVINMNVPLHFINAENSPAVKLGGGLVNQVLSELTVSCLPGQLPEFINVDLGNLQSGHSFHVSDLVLPAGVTTLERGEQVIASVAHA